MNDLIIRQSAINALCDNCDNVQAACPHYPCKQYTAIVALPSEQPEQQWISCSERTPDSPIRVMARLENEWIITAWYDDEEEKWYSVPPQYDDHDCWLSLEDIGYTVLAWMPLPEP